MAHEPVDYVIGVDPGLTGALIAVRESDGEIMDCIDMPAVYQGNVSTGFVDGAAVLSFVKFWHGDGRRARAVIENVQSRPGQGLSSTFKFGTAFGGVVSVLLGTDMRVDLVQPAVWKRHHGLIGTVKDAARVYTLKLVEERQTDPLASDRRPLFKRKKDGGRSDSYLIADYGRVKLR